MSAKPPTSNPHNAGQTTNHAGQAMNPAGLFQANQAAGRIKTVQEALQAKANPNTP